MATKNRKPQLYRRLSYFIPVLLIGQLWTAPGTAGDIDPSRYTPFAGDKFYLLSETTFSSDEIAKVRLETPGRKDNLEGYSGVDVRLYRIPNPIEFLRKQKDLHRPALKGNYQGEGLSNALNYLWDSWYKKSRLAWQRIFSFFVRKGTVESNPELKQAPPHIYQTKFENNPQFKPISGFEVVDEFRYPLLQAKPIAPPTGVALAGSSSNFLQVKQGNIYIPVGKQKPGLYLVEAMIGSFRGSAFLFVSDTVGITKLSSHQELIWAVDRRTGVPVQDTKLLFTDGVGVLGQGTTGKDGIFIFEGKNLERSYVLGADKTGGVFVSENFYYDSEVYGTKLYVFTDRPLYRPGDAVSVKLLGREFKNSSQSNGIEPSAVSVSVIDSEGTIILNKRMEVARGINGGDLNLKLPEYTKSGGYTLQITYKQGVFNSAFRVANYVKPHFEGEISFNKKDFKTNEPIKGAIKLTYSNGDAVKNAKVELEIRKQKLTIVEGELQYLDRFPVRVSKNSYSSNDVGTLSFDVPAAAEPSRYVVTARVVDSASYRVIFTREVLVQTSASLLALSCDRNFSKPKENTSFRIRSEGAESEQTLALAATWEAIRLQDQSRLQGTIGNSKKEFAVQFDKSGSYTISVKDKDGIVLASTNHWVQGPELVQVPGTISILLDKDEYEAGSTANVLLTFSEKISDALVTLERDKVEQHSLVSSSNDWITLKRISDREFKGEIRVSEKHAPNMTLSLVYVSNGHYFFENRGIKVAFPKINVAFRPDKQQYQPGDTVNIQVETTLKGRPIESTLSVSVVDEMIYVLQPEIAPDISDFFYHPRRNQVRTSSSLSFHSFDAASSATGATGTSTSQYAERNVKLRERPRREEKDTAFWVPTLKTDNSGKAKFSFVMPDSLTRWRITGRAIASNGMVGQRRDYLVSQKDFYLKWTGPSSFRKGDQPNIGLVVFNLGAADKNVHIDASGVGVSFNQNLLLHPGSNYVTLALKADSDGVVTSSIKDGSKVLDQLETPVSVAPVGWMGTQTLTFDDQGKLGTPVPPGAFNLRLSAASGEDELFFRAIDYLTDYPYGCVEQTSSRLLPLALAFSDLRRASSTDSVLEKMHNCVTYERLRLINMAGPEAKFSWWGEQTSHSAFMTAYAYYADSVASQALDIKLPPNHWERVLETYKTDSDNESVLNKLLILWMASEMELPIKTLAEGVVASARDIQVGYGLPISDSEAFSETKTEEGVLTALLLSVVAKRAGIALPAEIMQKVAEAQNIASKIRMPFATSAYLLSREGNLSKDDRELAANVLDSLLTQVSTIDRSLSLAFLHKAIGLSMKSSPVALPFECGNEWAKTKTALGRPICQYRGKTVPPVFPDFKAVKPGTSLQVTYDSYQNEQHLLPIGIERHFYKLVQSEKALDFTIVPVTDEAALLAQDIYLDELKVTPSPGGVYRFGLVEAALPAGAEVEQTTWGMTVKGMDGNAIRIGSASFQAGDKSYSSAVETLSQPITLYHLVRFSQAGTFQIPPARFFRMYAPNQKALEGGNRSAFRTLVVR